MTSSLTVGAHAEQVAPCVMRGDWGLGRMHSRSRTHTTSNHDFATQAPDGRHSYSINGCVYHVLSLLTLSVKIDVSAAAKDGPTQGIVIDGAGRKRGEQRCQMNYELYMLSHTSCSASTLPFNPSPSLQASALGSPLLTAFAPGFYFMDSLGQYSRQQAPFTAHPRVSGGSSMNQSTSPHDSSPIVRSQYPTG